MELKRLVVVDISGFIFRAFYAVRPLHSHDGRPVNAVHGVLSMLLKLLSTYPLSSIILAKDVKGDTFRNEIYDEYKANRSAPPEDLVPQFDMISELIEKMKLPNLGLEGFEADDIIGSVVVQWKDKFDEILIASSDKDLMQFVDDKVKVLDTMKDKIYGVEDVFEKMGVRPSEIVDYLSIVGDSSDNIPGMKGIGAKGAAKLINEHGTLEKCIEVCDSFKGKKLVNAFENHVDDALLSKRLIEIKTDLDLKMSADNTEYLFYPSTELIDYLKDLGMKSMVSKMNDMSMGESSLIENEEKVNIEFIHKIVETDNIPLLISEINKNDQIGFFVKYDSDDIISRKIVAMSLSFSGEESWYFPFASDQEKIFQDFFKLTWGNSSKKIISNDIKNFNLFCYVNDMEISAKTFDVVQNHFLIDSSGNQKISNLVSKYLNFELFEIEKTVQFSELDVSTASRYSGERACSFFSIYGILEKSTREQELDEVYSKIDGPIIPVLAMMEKNGIMLNTPFLKQLEFKFSNQLKEIEKEVISVISILGDDVEQINLRSPKQVGDLLFEKLQLPVIRKTKTGYSTDVHVLEELNSMGTSEIPGLILKYRECDKLLSTYVKVLPEMVNKHSGRLHTSFHQHVAATGRLSSENPNIQNIPVRSPNGRMVRKGFVAKPGTIFLSADYSQIELRILAHFSKDPVLIDAFKNDRDIHAQTAAEISGISIEEVGISERTKAKAVNFGLMYGQSSFGLSKSIGISRADAKDYITKYFEKFGRVRDYLDSLKESCVKNGYVKTFHGRKRFVPDISSQNRNIKAAAERVAVNSPIQGTAADIIKVAMINIQNQIFEKGMKSKMLIQVHDELIFEVVEDELKPLRNLVRQSMENVVQFDVPLKVNIMSGVNWFDLK